MYEHLLVDYVRRSSAGIRFKLLALREIFPTDRAVINTDYISALYQCPTHHVSWESPYRLLGM